MSKDPGYALPYWRVELWFYDSTFGTMASAGGDIPANQAATAEIAIAICKEWRQVTAPLARVVVQYRAQRTFTKVEGGKRG